MENDQLCNGANESLPLDTACITINNQNTVPVVLYSVVEDCYLCDGLKWADLDAESSVNLSVTTKYPVQWYYVKDGHQFCNETSHFQEYGIYELNITESKCSINILNEPRNAYLPILAAFLIFIFLFLVSATYSRILCKIKLFTRRLRRIDNTTDNTTNNTQPIVESEISQDVSKTSARVRALDTFRGIAVLLMVFVNNGGGKYVFFEHSAWNGLTVADLVLPWFAWITGFTLYRSIHIRIRLSVPRKKIIYICFKRSVNLIFLGLMINSLHYHHGVTLQTLRYPGILQLLAISYFICCLLEITFMKTQRNFQYGRFMFMEDILDSWLQWLIVIAITVGRTLIVFLLPVPNCPTGYIGPGGYHEHGLYKNCTGGAVGYIDRYVFGNHIYNSTKNPVYGEILPHDPEGLLNIIGAILIVYCGIQASKIVIYYHNSYVRIILWCLCTSLIAALLCNFSKENGVIPMNKKMMSLSYVLFTSSSAFLMWAILHYIIDNKKFWSGIPFLYAGANPILVYVGHYLTRNVFPWSWQLTSVLTHSTTLMMNLWTTTLWAIISYLLYIKDIVITV